MVDLRFTPEQEALRSEVSAWLEEHVPDLPDPSPMGPEYDPQAYPESYAAALAFNKKLAERGWLTAHWPKEYGGLGLSIMEQVVVREEFARYDAPIINTNGLGQLGPVLMLYGSEEQKRRHLPGIAKAEVMWCQGYSEPNAGSDLASLQTRAVKDGDDFVINGGKIWTGHGKGADWMFLLARTDPDAPKHKGITFFLVDMRTPGITVVPLAGMHGGTMGCQEYFEDVRIPQENVVGELNRGWYIGAALLDFERSGIAGAVESRKTVERMIQFYRDNRPAGGDRSGARSPIRRRLAEHVIETEVLRAFSYRIASIQERGEIPNYEASIGKMFGSEVSQRIGNTWQHLTGLFGQAGDGSRWDDGIRTGAAVDVQNKVIGTIAGGSSEIQRHIIATRGLGLPRG